MMAIHALPNDTDFANPQEVRRFANLLIQNGQVIEIRVLDGMLLKDRLPYDKPRILNGWFNDVEALVTSLQQIASAAGIYATINPCEPALLAKVNNRLIGKATTATSGEQIIARRNLLFDLDPSRVANITGIPTNDTEHQTALDLAKVIRDTLRGEGWPEPVEIDSGNGAYLLYAIDLPANDGGLVERVLKGVAERFDTQQVHVDQTTFDLPRIMRVPGTGNCKGDGTEDRPHRDARLLNTPDEIQTVPTELLQAIAIDVEQEQPRQEEKSTDKGTTRKKRGKNTLSAKDFTEKHELVTVREQPYKGGIKLLLAECPFCHETDHNACVYDTPYTEPYIGFSCSHNRCKDLKGGDLWKLFEGEKKPSAIVLLTEIADQARLICTPSGALFARVPVNGHHEIVSINEKGSGFKRWLIFKFKREHGYVPNSDAVSQVMAGVQAEAEFAGEKTEVYTRVAEKNGCVYLDLANDKWQAVEISNDGWRVIICPPVYFRRPNGMLPLPVPATGGSLDSLKDLIDVKDEKDLTLITAWLVGTLHPFGPYPALNLNGERGSKKTATTKLLRNIVDPNIAPARTCPKDEREAAITAQNNMIISFDNLSSMPLWLSDIICRLATGGGYGTRELYSDDAERVFSARRPVIMNGIEDGLITQGDLLNRTIFVTLQPPDAYRSEEELDELFNEQHPQLLGALLTVASVALRDRKTVYIENPPRMADFAKWVAAAEPELGWKLGTFMEAYTENQANASSTIMDSSPVAKAIAQFMDNRKVKWTGLIGDLLTELLKYDIYKDAKKAPKAANTLSGHLKRIAPVMRAQGIDIQHCEHTKKGRIISITFIKGDGPGDDSGDDTHQKGDDTRTGDDTHHMDRHPDRHPLQPDEDLHSEKGDDGDDTPVDYTAFYPPLDLEKEEKREKNNGRADSIEKPSSPSSPETFPPGYLEDFWAIGKRLGYPEIRDLDLGQGMTGWNTFRMRHPRMLTDVIARLGVR